MKQTLQALLAFGRDRLEHAGIRDAELDAKYLLLEAFRTDQAHFLMDRSRELPDNEEIKEMAGRYRGMIGRRMKRVPLQQILGIQYFMGLPFFVNRHVLIPRQDTETLVELVLKEYKEREKRILDLCTGSGCIAISLAVLGKYESITAADLSREALKAAARNCERLLGAGSPPEGSKRRTVRFLEGDLFKALGKEDGQFDILVSNPPYIPSRVIAGLEPEVKDFEPRMALDGREDGLEFFRRIAAECPDYLKEGAAVYLEIGYDQGAAVRRMLEQQGFSKVRIIRDEAGNDRVAAARWNGKI